ncbi:MAG: YitT family protein [Eubacterium sp.]|nr:YitT family protein [Eubacterium sp.]
MSLKRKISSYGMLAVGTFFMAAGTNIVYEPMHMVTGGFAGIGIVLQEFFSVPLWAVTVILNIPLFIAAFYRFGIRFLEKTFFAAVCFSLLLAVVPQFPVRHTDYLMAAIIGGSLNGLGLALVFRQSASTGGTDLLASLLKLRFPSVSSGMILAILDGSVVIAGMAVFGLRIGIYAVMAVFITSWLMDRILEGFRFAKMLYIISDKPEEISAGIMEKIHRGVTALEGMGMYSKKEKRILMCAVSRKEAVTVIHFVKQLDSQAFIVLSDAREVLGEGFESGE